MSPQLASGKRMSSVDLSRQLVDGKTIKIPNGTFQPSPTLKQWQTKLGSKGFGMLNNSENSRYSKNKDIAGTYDS